MSDETKVPSFDLIWTAMVQHGAPIKTRLAVETAFRQSVESIAARLAAAEAERDRLAAIVERLPVTADGVPVVPGMTVWVLAEPCYSAVVRDIGLQTVEVHRPGFAIVWHDSRHLYAANPDARDAAGKEGK